MANFDLSKNWVIVCSENLLPSKKCVQDLSRCIGLLSAIGGKPSCPPPIIADSRGGYDSEAVIIVNNEGSGPERNGFQWSLGEERAEIHGESSRGLCNGIYSFLSAIGLSWPAPGREMLPSKPSPRPLCFPAARSEASELSRYSGNEFAGAAWQRFLPERICDAKRAVKNSDAFTLWAARQSYDAVIFPLRIFALYGKKMAILKKRALEFDIAVEAGGRDLSTLVPRKYFFFRRDFFRMEDGRRMKNRHFCPTNPGAIKLIKKAGGKLFSSAGDTKVFHLWPDMEKENQLAWCSCPSCRAFTQGELNRMGVNAAADALQAVKPEASIAFFEKPGEGGKISLRKNIFMMESLPLESKIPKA